MKISLSDLYFRPAEYRARDPKTGALTIFKGHLLVAHSGNETSVTFEEIPIGLSIPVTDQMLSQARQENGIVILREHAPSAGGNPDSDSPTEPPGSVAA